MRLSYEVLLHLASLGDMDALLTMDEWDNIVHSYSNVGIECYLSDGVFMIHTYEPRVRPLKSP
jgi:phage gp29-like protein